MGTPQQDYFDRWAWRYNRDLASFDYAVPQAIASAILQVCTPSRLLDIGIGTGLCAKAFQDQIADIAVTGVDVSARMLEACPFKDVQQLDAAITALPFIDGMFDAVISGGAIEFMPDLTLLIAEVARVLQQGGVLALAFETHQAALMYPHIRAKPDHIVVRRLSWRPWPRIYYKYLYMPDAVTYLCRAHGLEAVSQNSFVAYRRPNGQVVAHDVMVFRKT